MSSQIFSRGSNPSFLDRFFLIFFIIQTTLAARSAGSAEWTEMLAEVLVPQFLDILTADIAGYQHCPLFCTYHITNPHRQCIKLHPSDLINPILHLGHLPLAGETWIVEIPFASQHRPWLFQHIISIHLFRLLDNHETEPIP
jgi:hypothetical protein